MYYYIDFDKQAPSGISLIIQMKSWKLLHNIDGHAVVEPEDYKIIHNQVAYLGGTVDDLIGDGISRDRIWSDRESKKILRLIFRNG